MNRKLIAVIACRNQGTRLYGKPVQNLDIDQGLTILDYIIFCLKTIKSIDEIVLAISDEIDNKIYENIAIKHKLNYNYGDKNNVVERLYKSALKFGASDVFRVTSESPFIYFQNIDKLWEDHKLNDFDATFFDEIVDGCGYEIISLKSLKKSLDEGQLKHKSEFCTLFIRENKNKFKINKVLPRNKYIRKDLRLTVDHPEDLVVCRKLYNEFSHLQPRIPINLLIDYLDNNPDQKKILSQFTEEGYNKMYL